MRITPDKFSLDSLDYQNIELLAYHLYMHQDCQECRSLENWIEAERQLSENLFYEEKPVYAVSQELNSCPKPDKALFLTEPTAFHG